MELFVECVFAVPYTKTTPADGFGDAACMEGGGATGPGQQQGQVRICQFRMGQFQMAQCENRRPNLKAEKEGPGIYGSSSRMPRCHDTAAGQHGARW